MKTPALAAAGLVALAVAAPALAQVPADQREAAIQAEHAHNVRQAADDQQFLAHQQRLHDQLVQARAHNDTAAITRLQAQATQDQEHLTKLHARKAEDRAHEQRLFNPPK